MNIFKSLFLFILGGSLLFSSCSNEENDVDSPKGLVEKTFSVKSASSESRAAINDFNRSNDNMNIHWQNGDLISVFASNSRTNYSFKFINWFNENEKKTGDFKGDITPSDNSSNEFWVLYPYQPEAELTAGGDIKLTIPDNQKATKNSFDPRACLQVGKASGTSVTLKNMCAFFYLTVKPGCTGIELSANISGWNLAGTVLVNASSGSEKITSFVSNGGKSTITVTDIPTKEEMEKNSPEGETYFIAFVPTSGFSSSFGASSPITLRIKGYGDDIVRTIKGSSQFNAGTCWDLGVYPKEQRN